MDADIVQFKLNISITLLLIDNAKRKRLSDTKFNKLLFDE